MTGAPDEAERQRRERARLASIDLGHRFVHAVHRQLRSHRGSDAIATIASAAQSAALSAVAGYRADREGGKANDR